MKRNTLCALAAGVAAVSFGADIVHDAGLDLMMNARSANVYTNRYGGVWSFMKAEFTPDTTAGTYITSPERTLLPFVRTYDALNGFTVARGPSDGPEANPGNPVIAVNPSPINDTVRLSNNANDYFAAKPGQISIHPGDKLSAVLRFTVPRDGRYSVEAKFWHQNSGYVGMVVLTNGAPAKAWQARLGSNHQKDIYDYSIKSASYQAGDTIEVVIDRQFKYASNATGVKFAITEEDAEFIDLNAAFARGEVAPSYVASTNLDDKVTSLKSGFYRSNQAGFKGYSKNGGTSTTAPWIVTNSLDVIASEGTDKILAPGDIMALPDTSNCLVLRYVPTAAARYDVGVELYDMVNNTAKPGVTLSLRQGGLTLGSVEVSRETAGKNLSDSLVLRDVALVAGLPLDLVLDSNGGNSGDNTAIRWGLVKTGGARYDGSVALARDLRGTSPSNPLADGMWSMGTVEYNHYGESDLTLFTSQQQKTTTGATGGTAKGWTSNATKFASPYWAVNMEDREVSGMGSTGYMLGKGEMVVHPQAADPYGSSTLVFTAPATGVYSAHMIARDINAQVDKEGSGVDLHIVTVNAANHQYPANGETRAEGTSEDIPLCELAAEKLHLRKGETVRFVVGYNGSPSCDATGVRAWVDKEDAVAGEKSINVDFNGYATGETPAGTLQGEPGRFGWSNDRWNGVSVVSNSLARLESRRLRLADATMEDDDARTTVRVVVTRRNGKIAASAANRSKTNAMIQDGIVSTSTDDVYDFTITGLTPNATYDLAFYSRTTNPKILGAFTIGGVTKASKEQWFAASGDCATFKATADANGEIAGTYASATKDETSFWGGFSITGTSFAHATAGMSILVR